MSTSIVDTTDFEKCEMGASSSGRIPIPRGPKPATYLNFAKDDLNDAPSQRAWVNSLSNAKRALHFQVDLLSEAFGIKQAKLGKRLSFPEKLKFCVDCGVVGPRILNKINHLRNAVEHDYYIPTKDEAEDFVDVVELFLSATNPLINNFHDWVELFTRKKGGSSTSILVHIDFAPNKGVINISATKSNGKSETKDYEIKAEDGAIYYKWVKFILSRIQEN